MNRRQFLGTGLALAGQPKGEWDGPVIDIHLHPRRTAGPGFAHVEGCGATNAVLLTNLRNADWAKAETAYGTETRSI